MHLPNWFKITAVTLAVLIAGILLGGILAVPYRFVKSPHGYEMSRLHYNTKNSTRFLGDNLEEVSARVSRATYPATSDENAPAVVFLYAYQEWQTGLAVASFLRPLNAILLPATSGVAEEVNRLRPAGSPELNGARVILLNGVQVDGVSGQEMSVEDLATLGGELGAGPRHAILVDVNDPGTALLAAPWAAYSGDRIVFDAGDIPDGIPTYTLGNVQLEGAKAITGNSPAEVAVAFAAFDDADNPFFGWGMNANSPTGYRAYTLARIEDPAMALLSANLSTHGKPGPLLWTNQKDLPQVVNNYIWSQRAAFWVTPAEGPFHHFFVLGGIDTISFPAQGQADYAVEIGPYLGKGIGMSGIDLIAAAWVALGIVSAVWILFHERTFLPYQNWIMQMAWPLMAMMVGPFGIPLYYLAYSRPIIKAGKMILWDRPLWLQGMVATVSAVGFGASIMIVSGWLVTFFGAPLIPNRGPLTFLFGTPMILIMVINYIVAVIVSWLLFQNPMLAMFYGLSYRDTLTKSLPLVLASMAAAALAMNPMMWAFMMWEIPMMPTEESILWFGVMFVTGFMAFLMAWPLNYWLIRVQRKSGLM